MGREGRQKELCRLGVEKKRRGKEEKERRLEWKGRVKGRNYSIIIIVIIRRGRERIE